MSNSMWAGTVVDPPGPTSEAIVSVTSISRSVAFRLSLERSARNSTLARIGMVLRRSTTRWTWPSDLRSSERSTVTFIAHLSAVPRRGWRGARISASGTGHRSGVFQAFNRAGRRPQLRAARAAQTRASVLQLSLERLDLLGERRIVAGQRFDLADRVQHRGVIAAAEAPADLG